MIEAWFLELVRCPQSGSRLSPAGEALVARLNVAIAAGRVVDASGETVTRPVDGGLVDSPPTLFYPIRNEIASLVAGDCIELAAIAALKEAV